MASPLPKPEPPPEPVLENPPRTVIHTAVRREDIILHFDRFSLEFEDTAALSEITLPIPREKTTALIGPSGCGKSTLLRSVNRMNELIEPVEVSGSLRLNGKSVYADDMNVHQLRRRIGMVFQTPNLFPMSIMENVIYPLQIAGERNRNVLNQVGERCLRRVGLWDEVKGNLKKRALTLSQGQQQRLCFARAIAGDPEVLLLDEPSSALDPIATEKIENVIGELRQNLTILLVTHQVQQAARCSDFVAFLSQGRVIEYGPTPDVFLHPKVKQTQDYITGRFQ